MERYICVTGKFTLLSNLCEASDTRDHSVNLKEHVKLPLPSGSYRIGLGFEPYPKEYDRIVYAEFSVK